MQGNEDWVRFAKNSRGRYLPSALLLSLCFCEPMTSAMASSNIDGLQSLPVRADLNPPPRAVALRTSRTSYLVRAQSRSGSFRKTTLPAGYSALLFCRLPKTKPRSATVLLDELEPADLFRAFAPLREPQSHSATVLRNELHARSFEGRSHII